MITIRIPGRREFWRAVALFGYRRWALPCETKPVGIPGNRDPDHTCCAFAPRSRLGGDFPCQGDAHWLCAECAHFVPEPDESDEGGA